MTTACFKMLPRSQGVAGASRPSAIPLGVRSIPAAWPKPPGMSAESSSRLDVKPVARENSTMSETRQRHRKKRGLGLSLVVMAALGCAVPAFARDDPLKAMISAEHDLDVMCRGGSPEEFTTVEACKRREKIVKALYGNGFCYGKKGQTSVDMQWHKCRANSLREFAP
jgi:hypothetical protein